MLLTCLVVIKKLFSVAVEAVLVLIVLTSSFSRCLFYLKHYAHSDLFFFLKKEVIHFLALYLTQVSNTSGQPKKAA